MFIKRLINKIFRHKEEGSGNSKPSTPYPDPSLLNDIDARLQKLEGNLDKAITGYRLMLINNNPDILPELISGESIEGLDSSLLKAKELTIKIKDKLDSITTAERIPGGAPPRSPPNIDNLSSEEKIRYGLQNTNHK
jgi:hypothetical protein